MVLGFSNDPCAGAVGSATLTLSQAQCALTGVTAAQYGNIKSNPAAQYNVLSGGNPQLAPEIADTYSGGRRLHPQLRTGSLHHGGLLQHLRQRCDQRRRRPEHRDRRMRHHRELLLFAV